MSVWATAWAYEQTVKPVGRKFVLVAIADFCNADGWCFPSQETLAGMTDQGISTVREHLKELEKSGLIKREARYGKKGIGRISDGFWLQAPKDRLIPPSKSKPLKAGGKVQRMPPSKTEHTAETAPTIPPKAGDDPLKNHQEPMSDYALLFDRHYKRVSGDVQKASAQGKAIKEILARHSAEKALACYESQLRETWRKGHVDWLTVRARIAEFQFHPNGNGKHDAAWHERQAELARKLGREYRPDAT